MSAMRAASSLVVAISSIALLGACGPDPIDHDVDEALCGNGLLDPGEDCDGSSLDELDCADFGFYEGALACSADCSFDLSGCGGYCGDESRNGPEECDGDELGEASCETLGYYGGALACAADCTIDDSGCQHGYCGDGLVNGPEQCDGENLGEMSCEALGYHGGGELACNGCLFDVSGCLGGYCGDGEIDEPEDCDGDELGGLTCADFDFYRGELACSEACSLDTSGCEGSCGDGVVDADDGEVCDDGVNDGVYGCMPDCDARAPIYCGDSVLNGAEECDGEDLGEASCESLGFLEGTLRCGEECLLDKTDCVLDWSCAEPLVDVRDAREYPTLELGGLCWMGANLDVGVRIDSSLSQLDQELIEKYCFADDPSNCETYGGLYQWNQAMGYVTVEGASGVCPEGWRLPTDEEWKELEMALGMTRAEADLANTWRGAGVGPALKTGGSSGFEALLGGGRWSTGDSNWLDQMGYFWTSTMGASGPWRRCLSSTAVYADEVGRWDTFNASFGMSVRCVTD